MNLRVDLTKEDKAQLVKDCKEVLDNFDPSQDSQNLSEGIFNSIDT